MSAARTAARERLYARPRGHPGEQRLEYHAILDRVQPGCFAGYGMDEEEPRTKPCCCENSGLQLELSLGENGGGARGCELDQQTILASEDLEKTEHKTDRKKPLFTLARDCT